MVTRRFDPTTQRFLQLDQFQGALADLQLSSDPLTQNRYDLGASNPLSGIEYDGHMFVASDGGGGSAPSPQPTAQKTSQSGGCGFLGLSCVAHFAGDVAGGFRVNRRRHGHRRVPLRGPPGHPAHP
jgi:hypothetical protein